MELNDSFGTKNYGRKIRNHRKLAVNTKQKLKNNHDAYVQDLIAEEKTNKKFSSYIKSQRNKKTGIADIF